jgi:hypothetical protein
MADTNTRFTNAWARQQTDWYGDPDRFTVSSETDPAHGDKGEAPPPLMMDAATAQPGGEIATDVKWENYDHLEPSLTIDEEPVGGQGSPEATGHGYGGITQPGADIGILSAMRGRDRGAAKRKTSSEVTYKLFSDLFFGFFSKGWEPPPITHNPGNPVFIRGINSHAVNNGPQARPDAWSVTDEAGNTGGWKRGDYEGSAVQRDFSPPYRRVGQVKMVEADIVTIIGDAPPPNQSDTYASPFSSLQKFMPTFRRVRGIRREPGPWDEDLQATDVGVAQPTGADGLVVN